MQLAVIDSKGEREAGAAVTLASGASTALRTGPLISGGVVDARCEKRSFSFLIVDVPASYRRNLLRDCYLAGTLLF